MKPDYEKKYKDALKLSRSYYSEDTNTFLDTLFPELRESEDERIRKGIIEIIKAVSGPDCDVYLDEKKQEKYIAWLEKQKEQKPAEWREEDEQMRCNILNALTPNLVYSCGKGTSTGTSMYKYDEEIKWLKSIRPQPKQELSIIPLTFYCGEVVSEWGYNIWADDNLEINEDNTPKFKTYEEACEAAIKYCLENLI